LSYARSRDFVHWETASGRPLPLPIQPGAGDIIDPVPAGGGLINGGARLGFDARGRAIVAYHKYNAAGVTAPYLARLDQGRWTIHSVDAGWDYRWAFGGNGSLVSEVQIEAPRPAPGGRLRVSYRHAKHGRGAWLFDAESLRLSGHEPYRSAWPAWMETVEAGSPGMRARFHARDGFTLRWETLDANRDRPREGPPPSPSMLRVYDLRP
jgi:hypothetical protein